MGKRKKNKSLCLVIGFFLLSCSTLFVASHFSINKYEEKKEDIKIEKFFEEEKEYVAEITEENKSNEEKKENEINYTMVIEIPKIGLKKGLCSIGQWCNAIKYNIEVNTKSNMPNVDKGNLILASHNGSSSISYFNKLDRLNIGDSIYLYYQGIKYEYILDNYYDIAKTGKAAIKRDSNKSTITLITCKKNTNNKQVVYIAYLNNKEEY